MTGFFFVGIAGVAGLAMAAAVFLLRTETPDNQARIVIGGTKPREPITARLAASLFKREPEPDLCEDSTLVKVEWLSRRLAQD